MVSKEPFVQPFRRKQNPRAFSSFSPLPPSSSSLETVRSSLSHTHTHTHSTHHILSQVPPPPPLLPLGGGDQILLYRGLKKAKRERGCTAKERITQFIEGSPGTPTIKRVVRIFLADCFVCVLGAGILHGALLELGTTFDAGGTIYLLSRHRWTGRYEAHLWDKSTWNQNQNKKGKQGAYDDEEAAARAYDLAALKYWGPGTLINFPVTDYSRDLEEMQNVSREDYLASLRRFWFLKGYVKISAPLQFGQGPAPDYNSEFYGDDVAAGSGYSTERKIDLSNHIKWWGANKSGQTDFRLRALDETNIGFPDDVASELKDLECSAGKPTEPYEMPRLGFPPERLKHKKISALSTLLNSDAYKRLEEKVSKNKEKDENNENENKNNILDKIEVGKTADRTCHDGGSEGQEHGLAFGLGGGLSIHRNAYPLTSLLSAPLITNYNGIESIDPLADSALWSNLIPVLQSGPGSSNTNEVCYSSAEFIFI
ncbi:AP2-like ethylene-responsive transcription factor [Striga asiatica]|uniref:AP2-like ethylene-responsive transcription factor n=1 Tax=Striga asiatica TaxID=4170 RepID=A0A5A7PW03_STRAF|nr:AP2-like ethylene-responsive transcription factor [Striga asiatica]